MGKWLGTLEERFNACVELPPIEERTTACWRWVGHLSASGYGRLHWKGKTLPAHRVSYERFVGAIPEGLQLDHLCRNRWCVNPHHLEPVTPRENTLRGNTLAAKNAQKTHCPQGHPYTEENTYFIRTGGRACQTCKKHHRRMSVLRRSSSAGGALGMALYGD